MNVIDKRLVLACCLYPPDQSPGMVTVAGGLLAATRLATQTGAPNVERIQTDSASMSDEEAERMYEEGYTQASELVRHSPGKARSETAAGNTTAPATDKRESVSVPQSTPAKPEAAGPAERGRSRQVIGKPPPLPGASRKISDPSPQAPASPPPASPARPADKKKSRFGFPYSDHILPSFSAKTKLGTLFKKKNPEDAKKEKPAARKGRSRSVTDVRRNKIEPSVPDAPSGSALPPKLAKKQSSMFLNKRGSIDDTFLENMKASAARPSETTKSENPYLLPADEDNMYTAVTYASPNEVADTLAAKQQEANGDFEYVDMSGLNGSELLPQDEEYQEMASFAGPPSRSPSQPVPSKGGQQKRTSTFPALSSSEPVTPKLHGNRQPNGVLVSPARKPRPSQSQSEDEGQLVIPRRFEESLGSLVPYSVKRVTTTHDGNVEPAVAASSPQEGFQLSDVKSPDDIVKLSTGCIRTFLRTNSVKYSENASRAELISEAKEVWSDGKAMMPTYCVIR